MIVFGDSELGYYLNLKFEIYKVFLDFYRRELCKILVIFKLICFLG